MNSAMSWSVKGIEPEVRAAAKTAARKSGQTLGQWLNALIMDTADGPGSANAHSEFSIPQNMPTPTGSPYADRIDQLERELAQLSRMQTDTAVPHRYGAGAIADPGATPLQHVLERLDRNETETLRAFDALHSRLGGLAQELSESRSTLDNGFADEQNARNEAFEQALKNVVDHIENSDQETRGILSEITSRLEGLDRQVAGGADAASKKILADVEHRLTALAHRVDQIAQSGPGELQGRIEEQIARLAEKVEQVASSDGQSAFRDQLSELQHRIEVTEQIASQAQNETPNGLDRQLAQIGDRLDSVQEISLRTAEQAATSVVQSAQTEFRQIEGQMRQLLEQIEGDSGIDPEIQQSISRLMEQTSALSQDVKQIKIEAASETDVQSVRSMVDNLSNIVEQQFSNATHDQAFSALEQRLNEVSTRLEQTIASPQQNEHVANLEQKVHEIDARLARAQVDSQSNELITALGQQIDGLAQRVSQSEEQHSGVQAIEKSIAQLFENVEQTRALAMEAAEVAKQGGPGGDAGDGSTFSALEQGLQALKASAENADQRNQETLEAVHDTLEKVITRLVALEEAPGAGTHGEQTHHTPGATPAAAVPGSELDDLGLPPIPPVPSPQGFVAEAPDDAAEPAWKAQVDAKSAEQMSELYGGSEPQLPPLGELQIDASEAAAPELDAQPENTVNRRNDFIAAARKAAQAAQDGTDAEQAGGPLKNLRRRRRGKSAEGEDGARNGKRRPLILAAIVLLMIGAASAYQVVGGKKQMKAQTPAPAAVTAPQPSSSEPIEEGLPAPEPDEPAKSDSPQTESRAITDTDAAIARTSVPAPGDSIARTQRTTASEKQPSEAPAENVAPADSLTTGSIPKTQKTSREKLLVPPDPLLMALPLMNPAKPQSTAAKQDPVQVTPAAETAKAPNAPAVPVTPVTKKPVGQLKNLPPAEIGTLGMRIAAVNGDPVAQFLVAAAYTEGEMVAQDFRKAAAWYQKSASTGLAPAQYRLATFYEKGKGVPEDVAAARIWYERAADKGNRKAMHNLAVIYADGSRGTPDFAKAGFWFRKAAELGLKDSQYNLGILHERGLGVAKDMGEAFKWFSLAAAQGDKDAQNRVTRIADRMSPEALIAAKLSVQNWSAQEVSLSANQVVAPEHGWRNLAANVSAEALATKQMIADAQLMLNKLGYSAGPADGLSGARTREAIRFFQKANGMAETGAVTPKLLDLLRQKTG